MIEIRNLRKSFDGKQVLTGFSCDLPEQGVIALMGASGIGKSTLMNILLGLVKPDSGEIRGTENLRFSAVFQEDRLMEQLSARENLRLTTGQTDARISGALRALGLNPDEKAEVRTYSGGMKRRVALARGALFAADVLLLDEPFRGLDERTRDQAIEFLLKEWAGRLILLVTHDMDEARLMGADYIISMGGCQDEL